MAHGMGLLRKPVGQNGKVHAITPEGAGWGYLGFGLYRLGIEEAASEVTGGNEVILVLVEGRAMISAGGRDFGEMGARMDLFDKTPPHCLYVPPASHWEAIATTDCTLAVCSAPASAGRKACRIGPEGISHTQQGKGTGACHINRIAMEDRDVAERLLVSEVFAPAGQWSCYPPHRHDEDDFPRMTRLELACYHRLNPAQGFGVQRVYTEDGNLDETMLVTNHDVVLVPRGHHPSGAPDGYQTYCLKVMAGPRRNLRFANDPAHEWIARRAPS